MKNKGKKREKRKFKIFPIFFPLFYFPIKQQEEKIILVKKKIYYFLKYK